ncbi:MAG: flagellar biosynthetic protein FliO [Phycisphaerales bacterium]|nr:flagellar biosynthetic protein FliO [Phycisphaerales bacterium]
MQPGVRTSHRIFKRAAVALAFALAPLSSAQHEADGLREAPRALANGPTALPLDVAQETPETPPPAENPGQATDAQDTFADRTSESATPIFAERGQLTSTGNATVPAVRPSSGGWGVVRTLGALAIVVGLVLALRSAAKWLAARAPSLGSQLTAGGRAPSGLLEVLGRYPVARGQKLVLLRLDRRILLLNQTSDGFSTLAELTDPEDVASILTKVRDQEGESIAARFTSVLHDMERDPTVAGDAEPIDVDEVADHPRSVRRALQQHEVQQADDARIVEPKVTPRSGADVLADRLRSMRERWA